MIYFNKDLQIYINNKSINYTTESWIAKRKRNYSLFNKYIY